MQRFKLLDKYFDDLRSNNGVMQGGDIKAWWSNTKFSPLYADANLTDKASDITLPVVWPFLFSQNERILVSYGAYRASCIVTSDPSASTDCTALTVTVEHSYISNYPAAGTLVMSASPYLYIKSGTYVINGEEFYVLPAYDSVSTYCSTGEASYNLGDIDISQPVLAEYSDTTLTLVDSDRGTIAITEELDTIPNVLENTQTLAVVADSYTLTYAPLDPFSVEVIDDTTGDIYNTYNGGIVSVVGAVVTLNQTPSGTTNVTVNYRYIHPTLPRFIYLRHSNAVITSVANSSNLAEVSASSAIDGTKLNIDLDVKNIKVIYRVKNSYSYELTEDGVMVYLYIADTDKTVTIYYAPDLSYRMAFRPLRSLAYVPDNLFIALEETVPSTAALATWRLAQPLSITADTADVNRSKGVFSLLELVDVSGNPVPNKSITSITSPDGEARYISTSTNDDGTVSVLLLVDNGAASATYTATIADYGTITTTVVGYDDSNIDYTGYTVLLFPLVRESTMIVAVILDQYGTPVQFHDGVNGVIYFKADKGGYGNGESKSSGYNEVYAIGNGDEGYLYVSDKLAVVADGKVWVEVQDLLGNLIAKSEKIIMGA